jgi:hypothetical protein
MECRECGFENSNLYKFCRRCGKKLRAIHEPPPGDVYIRLRVTDNETGAERIFEAVGRDVLVGRGAGCDLLLDGEDVEVFHCRLLSISNHLFYQSAEGQSRVDSVPFDIGRFTLCRC